MASTSWAQMKSYNDFVYVFHRDSAPESDSFFKIMATELKVKMDLIMDVENYTDQFPSAIYWDMYKPKIEKREGFYFATILIAAVGLDAFPATICWRDVKNNYADTIHLSRADSSDIEFDWCSDFPLEALKNLTAPRLSIERMKFGQPFEIDLYMATYPDVMIEVKFKESLTSAENDSLAELFTSGALSSNFSCFGWIQKGGKSFIGLDFNKIDLNTVDQEQILNDADLLIQICLSIKQYGYSDRIDKLLIW